MCGIGVRKTKVFMAACIAGFLLMIGFSVSALAAVYYVDQDAAGKADGTSWTDAWNGFYQIDWSRLRPGDTVFVSGGSTSKTYREPLLIGADGAAGVPITITRATDTGHDGKVIINGGESLDILISFENRSHVTISDLTLQVNSRGGRGVDIDESQSITVSGLTISLSGRAGIFVEESQDCLLLNNRIETVEFTEQQTDGIYSQRNRKNIYDGNHIVINNRYEDGHNDGIQSYMDDSLTIRNNSIELDNPKRINSQGIFCTTLSGTFSVYNNVVYAPNTYNSLIALKIPSPSFHAIIVSNTLIGGKWGSIKVEGDSHAVIKNNIVWDYHEGAPLTYSGDKSEVTHNLFDKDPKLDPSFVPTESSPALDAGAPLDSLYRFDKAGNPRPRGKGFDIGAYEKASKEDLPPRPPTGVRVLSGG